MSTLPGPVPYTQDEIARLSKDQGKRYELFDGQLVEKAMSMRSNGVASEIAHVLRLTYPKSQAHIIVEQPTYCFESPRQMRVPDVVLVWAKRLPQGLTDEELQIPPDLAVEVTSPTNTFDAVQDRVEEYLNAAVTNVWVVVPKQRHIFVYRQDGTLTRYRAHEVLKDEPLLPGLSFKVADVFPEPASEVKGT
jgi:Uma2 family endonuclease